MHAVLATLNAKYIHTSLAIRYLKAYAAPEFDVELAEYTINDPVMNIVTDLYKKQAAIIGFSCYIWNINETIEVINILKKIKPELIIVLGGPEVTYDTKEWMEKLPNVDYIVIGEGEHAFKLLLSALTTGDDVTSINGIAYRQHEKIIIKPPREKLDLKTIPSPYRLPEDIESLSKRVIYMETSRGCPFSCQFCLSSIEVGVRYFDKEKIKEDILYLMEHGAKTIKFVDRTFNISRSYAMDMFEFLIKHHKPGTVFQFEITADIMRPEVIEYLNENAPEGLFRFEIGVQSTNDYTNELVQRKQNFSKLARTVTMVKEGKKIVQHLDLIAGLPEEDYNSFRKTFNDVFAFEPEELQLGFLKLLRGTGLRLQREQFGYIFMDNPPYEILGNNVLSFQDIIRIKQVEDVLEKYWNAHRMDETILYLINNAFDSAFDFFQQFGAYWEEKGWSKIGHQLEDLFVRLFQFITETTANEIDIISGLMKYDYLRSKQYKPRKPWWDDKLEKKERSAYIKFIAEHEELIPNSKKHLSFSERDLHKHTVIEEIAFDIEHYAATKEIIKTPTLLMIYFDPHEKINHILTFPLRIFRQNE